MRCLRQPVWGQSVPQIMRSGAAAIIALPNGIASSQPLSITESRLPLESFSHQVSSRRRSRIQRNAGCSSPSEKSRWPIWSITIVTRFTVRRKSPQSATSEPLMCSRACQPSS